MQSNEWVDVMKLSTLIDEFEFKDSSQTTNEND